MKPILIGRDKELGYLSASLSATGHLRAGLVKGARGMGKSALLEAIEQKLLQQEKNHLFLSPKINDFSDPLTFCTSLVRSARSGQGINPTALNDFARSWGSRVMGLARASIEGKDDASNGTKLAEAWVKLLEKSLDDHDIPQSSITPILILDDLDQYTNKIIDWLSESFNQAIRKSALFTRARFLFSSKEHDSKLQGVFDRFGFEQVQHFSLPELSPNHCEKLAESQGYRAMGGRELHEISEGNPLKLLNIFNKSSNLTKLKSPVMSEQKKKVLPHFSDFSEEEFKHLLFASYLNRINRYNLEFLCPPRDAAFCYNWLRRQKKIVRKEPNGDLILDQEIRDQIQEFHRQDQPEEAERLNVIATILDAFAKLFPDPTTHWIPVNLQALDSFTTELCRKLFSQVELPEVLSFVEDHEEDFNVTGKQFSLNSDAKLLTQRFMEVGGGVCKDGFVEKARRQWELDRKEASEKRKLAEQEQLNLAEEALDIESQIETFKDMRDRVVEDFKNPAKRTEQKEYSFSSNKLLTIFGLGVISASLFSDSFGSIYAACGILLTLLGFFWPNVDIRKPAVATAGAGPKLAVETQQRSMDHRIHGLSSRAASIKTNLHNLSDELESLNQGLDIPYVSGE
jgi:hypothetical protein